MRRLRRFLLRFVLPLVIVAAVLVWSPLLSIRRIDVTGHQRYTTEEIRAVSGLTQGEHVFLPLRWSPGKWPATRLQTVKRSVERLPWVAAVRVEWLPLHDIRIRVTERQPFARLPYLGGFLLLDPEGVVLENRRRKRPPRKEGWAGPQRRAPGTAPRPTSAGGPAIRLSLIHI